jgi:hypothetical protein
VGRGGFHGKGAAAPKNCPAEFAILERPDDDFAARIRLVHKVERLVSDGRQRDRGGRRAGGGRCERLFFCSIWQRTSAHVSACQHTPAYVSIRQIAGGAALGVDAASAVSSVDIVGICTFVLVKQVE